MHNLGDDWLLKVFTEYAENAGHQVTFLVEAKSQLQIPSMNNDVIRWPSLRSLDSFHDCVTSINANDFLVFAGGGWFAADRNSKEMIIWWRRIQKIEIPIFTLSNGFGPFSKRVGKFFAKKALNKLSTQMSRPFHVRTSHDGRELTEQGVMDFNVGSDLALGDAIFLDASGTEMRSDILVSLPRLRKSLEFEDFAKWIENLKDFLLEYNREVYFLEMQSGEHGDYDFWKLHFPNMIAVRDLTELESVLQKTEYLVSGRLHGVIAGLAARVPNIMAISYHHKFDLLCEFGVEPLALGSVQFQFNNPNYDAAEFHHEGVKDEINSILGIHDI